MITIPIMVSIGLVIVITAILLLYARRQLTKANELLEQTEEKRKNIKKNIENERREAMLRLKDELHKKRNEFDIEIKRERLELERAQSKLTTRYEHIEKKEYSLDEINRDLQKKERDLTKMSDALRAHEQKVKAIYDDLLHKLERISNMSVDDAKKTLMETLEHEVRLNSQKWVHKIEEEARETAKEKSVGIVVTAMQRYTAEQVAPHSSGIVHLPSDDMKGRIIGKEGRNIKALEMATGMEFVIGETPEVISISGFNPIRREVARRSLEKLIQDGRINPTRIEETVAQCERDIEEMIQEYGKNAALEFNLQGLHPEIVTLLGKLHFRTSFTQNVLMHSKEVGLFARMIADELGLDGQLALRAGLLHDIGKAVTAEVEGPHAQIGADIAKRCGENPIVVNAIAAHHEEVPYTSIYGPIVVIADMVSASRPGARRETLTAYIKRLEKLEEIAMTFTGVKKAYALQAGREIRVIVDEDSLDDERSSMLARDLAHRIEQEMSFPGQIKVNVIREKRVIQYAK